MIHVSGPVNIQILLQCALHFLNVWMKCENSDQDVVAGIDSDTDGDDE